MANTTNAVLGYAPSSNAASPNDLASAIHAFVTNGSYRQQVLQDPNAAAKAAGLNVGSAKIQMEYQEIKGTGTNAGASQLLIVVNGAGVNWTGDVTLVLYK